MSTVANPLYASLVPGMNPSGNQINLGGAVPGATSPAGVNSFLPQGGVSTSPTAPVSPNPFAAGAVPGAMPTTTATGAVPGAAPTPAVPGINAGGGYGSSGGALLPGGGTNATGGQATDPFGFSQMTHKDKSRMFDSLKKTYGDGPAHMIMERGQENLMEQFSASGNRFGSGAQIGLADYLSQVNLNEGQLVTQMYEKSLDDYMNVMMGTADKNAGRIASSPSMWDSIMQGLGLAQAGGAGAAGGLAASAGGAGTAASILAGLAAI
jgi:hypothetical protein